MKITLSTLLFSIPALVSLATADEKVRLTPPVPDTPTIHGPVVYGARPGSPFQYKIPATGVRPMTFAVEGLPEGLSVNASGLITGALAKAGEHVVTLKAGNSLGETTRTLKIVCGDTIALTPPMGWSSWNCFGRQVSDADVRKAADAMVSTGLVNHGWTYINIDDGWAGKRGDDGKIHPNDKFPDMKSLCDYVHGKGLKIGIYTSPGTHTCAGFTGSLGYEEKDAKQYAEWGFDYLKYDMCSCGPRIKNVETNRNGNFEVFEMMGSFLKKQKRDIVYSICQYGWADVSSWGAEAGGQTWRTTGDIWDAWDDGKEQWEHGMATIGFAQNGLEKHAGPGRWNDPDMLVVGVVGWGKPHPSRLTADEQYTHVSLWSLLAAPLLIGADMTKMDDFTMGLLTNAEVLAIDQDPLGKQGYCKVKQGDLQTWVKPLQDGSLAVGIFNLGKEEATAKVSFSELGIEGPQMVRDVWRNQDLGVQEKGLEARIPSHGVHYVRLILRR